MQADPVISRRIAPQAAFVAVLCVAGLAAAVFTSRTLDSTGPSTSPYLLVGFAVAFYVARLLSIRFPQGDEAYVVLVVGVAALGVLDVRSMLVAAFVTGVFDAVTRPTGSPRSQFVPIRVLDALRSAAILGLLSPWQLLLHPIASGDSRGELVLLVVLLIGATYAVLDALTFAVQHRLAGGPSVSQNTGSLLRSIGSVYLVHVAMAAVALRAYPALGLWGFAIALLLALILQNSVSLYMRIRRAYAETIEALAHALELDDPDDVGHSRRVADLAVAVARGLGLSGNALSRVRYAALLHDVGRIGHACGDTSIEHCDRGAEIVASVAFLAEVAPLIEHQNNQELEPEMVEAAIIGVCSRFDRLRERTGVQAALATLRAEERGVRHDVVEAIERATRSRHQGVLE